MHPWLYRRFDAGCWCVGALGDLDQREVVGQVDAASRAGGCEDGSSAGEMRCKRRFNL